MYRTNTCGELRLTDAGKLVTLAGWVQRTRKMGGMTFVDLRDRYGLTQLVFDESKNAALCEQANKLGREWCIQAIGQVSERQAKNPKMPTGDIEILVDRWWRRYSYEVSLSGLAPKLCAPESGAASSYDHPHS